MTENPTAAGLSETERDALQEALSEDINDAAQNDGPMPPWWGWFITHKGSEQHTLTAVESIVTAHVTAAEDRMREAVEAIEAAGRVCSEAHGEKCIGGISYRDAARIARAALAPTAHDAATMPEVGR